VKLLFVHSVYGRQAERQADKQASKATEKQARMQASKQTQLGGDTTSMKMFTMAIVTCPL
jgi:hypothetical protein